MILRAEEPDRGKRLDWFIHERLAEASRSRIQAWIKDGRVLVDGAAKKASEAGYKNVAVMRDGIMGWVKAGQPVEKPKAATRS